jgi:hypothetical protein
MRRSITVFALGLLLLNPVFGQSGEEPAEPVPYTDDEFPQWLLDLRRAEVITLGSLPITITVSFFVYDLVRYALHGFDRLYNPFGSPNPVPYEPLENIGVFVAAGTTSLLIAVIDFYLGRAENGSPEGPDESP